MPVSKASEIKYSCQVVSIKYCIEHRIQHDNIPAPIHIHNWCVGPTIDSSFPVAEVKLKGQASHERLGCSLSSKFILFCVQ